MSIVECLSIHWELNKNISRLATLLLSGKTPLSPNPQAYPSMHTGNKGRGSIIRLPCSFQEWVIAHHLTYCLGTIELFLPQFVVVVGSLILVFNSCKAFMIISKDKSLKITAQSGKGRCPKSLTDMLWGPQIFPRTTLKGECRENR